MKKKIMRAPGLIILSENVSPEGLIDIQLLKTGTFSDPRYGKFSITRKMFSEMMDNFTKGTRGQDVSLDYVHDSANTAAAWIKELYEKSVNGETQLWAKAKLTGAGKKSLSEEEFKYISADFDPNYQDNEKGARHGCVLEGAALTNRPVIKGMAAVQLSEIDESDISEDDLTYDQLVTKLTELELQFKPLVDAMAETGKTIEDITNLLTPSEEDSMAMTEQEKKDVESKDAEIAELKAKVELSEKNSKFDKMLSKGTAVEAQRKFFLADDLEGFANTSSKVKLSEAGSSKEDENEDEDDAGADVEDEISEEAIKLSEKRKIKLSEAIKIVSKDEKFSERLAAKFKR